MGTRFVIIAAPRTGSNWLCARLRAQPDVWCHGEVFHPGKVWIRTPSEYDPFGDAYQAELRAIREIDRVEFLNRIFGLSFGRSHAGFKIFEGHGDREAFKLAKDQSLAKVILSRNNFLAVYASRLVALQTRAYSAEQMLRVERPPVFFSKEEFSKYRSANAGFYSRILSRLDQTEQPYFGIRYDQVGTVQGIAALLKYLGARTDVMPDSTPDVRGSSDILSRFSNPEVAEAYLREHGLMHWAYEGDVSL